MKGKMKNPGFPKKKMYTGLNVDEGKAFFALLINNYL